MNPDKRIKAALIFICVMVFAAVFADFISPWNPLETDVLNKFAPASLSHPLGTDHLGRDELSRLLYGIRMSLLSVLIISASVVALSFAVGLAAGYRGGIFDAVFMRICDVFLTFPTFILALFLIGILGVGLLNVVIAIVLTHWAWYARMVRGLVLEYKGQGWVTASRSLGTGKLAVVIRHILPSVFVQMIILMTLDLGHMLLHVSGLSFLGLGVQAPTPEWGVMISDAAPFIREHPMLIIYPGLCIFITVAVFNILGEALRDKLDPSYVYRGSGCDSPASAVEPEAR